MDSFTRIEALMGKDFEEIKRASVAIIGVGGVGSHAAMALARTGIEKLILMDPDTIKTSNFNRHAQGFTRYLGVNKAEAMKEEILGFRDMDIEVLDLAYKDETKEQLFSLDFDVLLDCIDVVTYKLQLIEESLDRNLDFITCLGTGNRLNPQGLEISSLYKSRNCSLARVLRREARKRNLRDFPVVLSKEDAKKIVIDEREGSRNLPASSYFTPASAGQLMAYWALEKILEKSKGEE